MDRLEMKDLLYSLGSFSAGLLSNPISTFAIFYYVDVLKAPVEKISLVMLLYGIWNAVNDPSFGYLSEYLYSSSRRATFLRKVRVAVERDTDDTFARDDLYSNVLARTSLAEVHTENRCEENDDGFNDPLGDPSQRVCIHQNFHPRIDIGLQSCDQPCRIVHRSGHHDRRNSRRRRGQNR